MTFITTIALLPALLGLALSSSDEQQRSTVRIATIQEEVIMRVPVQPLPGQSAIEWVKRDGPNCIPMEHIRGAVVSPEGEVDFLLRGPRRVRAEFAEDCPDLDFYGGFYLAPEDARVCAGRDIVRSRIGGNCRIESFHRLVPRKRQSP